MELSRIKGYATARDTLESSMQEYVPQSWHRRKERQRFSSLIDKAQSLLAEDGSVKYGRIVKRGVTETGVNIALSISVQKVRPPRGTDWEDQYEVEIKIYSGDPNKQIGKAERVNRGMIHFGHGSDYVYQQLQKVEDSIEAAQILDMNSRMNGEDQTLPEIYPPTPPIIDPAPIVPNTSHF